MMDFKNNSLQHSIWGGTNIRWTHWVTPCTPLHHFCTNLIPLGLTILSSFCCKDLFFSLLLSVVRVEGYQGPLVIHRGQFSVICETDIKIGINISMLRRLPEILIVLIEHHSLWEDPINWSMNTLREFFHQARDLSSM